MIVNARLHFCIHKSIRELQKRSVPLCHRSNFERLPLLTVPTQLSLRSISNVPSSAGAASRLLPIESSLRLFHSTPNSLDTTKPGSIVNPDRTKPGSSSFNFFNTNYSGTDESAVVAGECHVDESAANIGQLKSLEKHDRHEALEAREKAKRQKILHGSTKVVLTAMASNFSIMCMKFAAAMQTGSASMFSEGIHSLADLMNECLLFWGITRSVRDPDPLHPYGFSRERYAWALVSGVGIFFLGCGASLYHGISGLYHPSPMEDVWVAFAVLGGSLLFEGGALFSFLTKAREKELIVYLGTMTMAFKQVQASAAASNVTVMEYIKTGADPSAVQVLLEDCASVTGIVLASSCLGLSYYFENPVFDSVGSITIGLLLGGVASFLIKRNISLLVETSMPLDRQKRIVNAMLADPVVTSVHDVKSTALGPEYVRFKAEVQFNGEAVAKRFLQRSCIPTSVNSPSLTDSQLSIYSQYLTNELQKVKEIKTEQDMEKYLLTYGNNLVESLAAEVDRIELKIKKVAPEVKHCDLEIL
ncbi:cation efflux family-domain-containing protein [Paraphysoderma sedebokerense]|nr:cation efflux family-domain-containing protein [Paraphysoderma sedebokerense]